MNWLGIIALIFQYGPELFRALAALFTAIKTKNASQGATAVSQTAKIAEQVVLSLASRNDMTNDQKREQAWKDVQAAGASFGITISESEARTVAELALQKVKQETMPSDAARTIGMKNGPTP